MKYKDTNLPIAERVEDLLSRLNFQQKIDQITCLVTIGDDLPDFKALIPSGIGNVGAFTVADSTEKIAEYSYRLQKYLIEETEFGIPALIHCEAVSGGQFTGADVYPSPIAQASSWNPELIEDMAKLISKQMYAVGFRQALSPVLDICRDPRWGRLTETYGEDPTLASAMGSAFIRGIQGADHTKGIAATAKHFVGHGVTEGALNMSRSMISPRDMEEVHCKPFQAAITEANLMGVMSSYCSYNGEPVTCSKVLLTDLLRGRLNFKGAVVSDYIAADRIVDPYCVAETYEEAGIKAIKAGLDVEYPRPKCFTVNFEKAVQDGDLDMEVINNAVRRVLTMKFQLGLFEQPYPDRNLLSTAFGAIEAKKLNLKLAEQTITLLKNDQEVLPLSKSVKKIAVIGPHSNLLRSYFSTFSYPAVLDMTTSREEDGQELPEPGLIVYEVSQRFPGEIRESSKRLEQQLRRYFPESRTLYEAIKEYVPNAQVACALGVNYTGNDLSGMEYALELAAQADVIILTLGGKNGWGVTSTVGEGIDSTSIDLPGRQEEFAKSVYALGKKCVVVHFDGRPLSNKFVATHFDAIIEAWQPGQYGGQALTSVLFGDYNPSGRLPVTAARNSGQLPVYYGLPRGSGYVGAGHPGMIINPNGYINDTAKPLYYFGHGLSYTTFKYEKIELSSSVIKPEDTLSVTVSVKNVGKMDGDEVVQLYIRDCVASVVRPTQELIGFKRVFIPTGERKTIKFVFSASQLAFLDYKMDWKVEAGKFDVLVGSSCVDIRLQDTFSISEDKNIDGTIRGFYAGAEISN